MSMLDEHQFADPHSSATLDNPYTYSDRPIHALRDHWHDSRPAQLFRYRVIKRCLDLFLVLIATPVLLPLVVIIALSIMWSSPGPIFFSHRRIRKNGAFFSMWKFRTMCVNSTEVLEE